MSTIRFDCDSCGTPMQVPASKAGKKGKCPQCGEPIQVPETLAGSTPDRETSEEIKPARASRTKASRSRAHRTDNAEAAEVESEDLLDEVGESEVDVEERPRPRKGMSTKTRWKRTGLGIQLLLIATAVSLGSTVLGWFFSFVLGVAGLTTYLTILWILTALPMLLTMGGYVLCLFVPPQHGSRNLVLATLGAQAVSIIITMTMLGYAWSMVRTADRFQKALESGDPEKLNELNQKFIGEARDASFGLKAMRFLLLASRVSSFLSTGQFLIFLFFLRGLALSLRDSNVVAQCENLIQYNIIVVSIGLVLSLASGIGGGWLLGFLGFFFTLIIWVSVLLSVGIQVWFLILLLDMRKVVERKAHRRKKRPAI